MTIYRIWMYIFSFGVGEVLISSAITGSAYSQGRGGNRALFLSVKSIPLRVILFLLGAALISWTARDVIHRIAQ